MKIFACVDEAKNIYTCIPYERKLFWLLSWLDDLAINVVANLRSWKAEDPRDEFRTQSNI